MIQRTQTLWFLLASIAAFLTLKFPFYNGTYLKETGNFNPVGHDLIGIDNTYLLFATILLGGLSFVNIFLFKNRSLQIKLGLLAILVEAVVLFLYVNELKNFSNGGYQYGSVFHLLVLIGLFLGIRGVYKDQKLVKESSRLR